MNLYYQPSLQTYMKRGHTIGSGGVFPLTWEIGEPAVAAPVSVAVAVAVAVGWSTVGSSGWDVVVVVIGVG